jgi:hypothetical protein
MTGLKDFTRPGRMLAATTELEAEFPSQVFFHKSGDAHLL